MVEVVEISRLECNWIFWVFFYFNTKLGNKVGMISVVQRCILTAAKVVENIHPTVVEVVKISGFKCNWIF